MFNILKFFKSKLGMKLLSILLGLGLASLFKKVCIDDNCLIIKSPPNIEGNTFKFQDKCYTYTPHSVTCPN